MRTYRWTAILVALPLLLAAMPNNQSVTADFVGTWQVDLRPTPESPSYFQELKITSIGDGTFRGRFYDSDIENGRFNDDWGTLHFAFTTRDGSGIYHTTGQLLDGKMTGTTHSLGRGFLSVWTAEPKP